MIIIWGTKVKRMQAGVAGEYCPLCRNITKHSVTEVRSVSHLYYIPLGGGTPQFYELLCGGCQSTTSATLQSCRPMDDRDGMDVIDLAESTHVGGAQDLLERMELDAKTRGGSASTDDRMQTLLEPFMHIEYSLQKEMRTGSHASLTSVVTLAFVLSSLVAFFMWMTMFLPTFRPSASYIVGSTLVTILAVSICIWTIRRHKRTPKYALEASGMGDALVKSLQPLKPTRDELREIIRELKKRRALCVGKAITVDDLHEMVAKDA